MFGSNFLPKPPPSILITESFPITDNSFTKMFFGFGFPIQTQIHSQMIKNTIGAPQHNFSEGFGKFSQGIFAKIRPSIIPYLQKLKHSFSFGLNSLIPFPKAKFDMFSKIEIKYASNGDGREQKRNNYSNEPLGDDDYWHNLLLIAIASIFFGILQAIILIIIMEKMLK